MLLQAPESLRLRPDPTVTDLYFPAPIFWIHGKRAGAPGSQNREVWNLKGKLQTDPGSVSTRQAPLVISLGP